MTRSYLSPVYSFRQVCQGYCGEGLTSFPLRTETAKIPRRLRKDPARTGRPAVRRSVSSRSAVRPSISRPPREAALPLRVVLSPVVLLSALLSLARPAKRCFRCTSFCLLPSCCASFCLPPSRYPPFYLSPAPRSGASAVRRSAFCRSADRPSISRPPREAVLPLPVVLLSDVLLRVVLPSAVLLPQTAASKNDPPLRFRKRSACFLAGM